MSQLSQYSYGVHAHGVLTDNASNSAASMVPYPYSPNVVSPSYSSTLPQPPAESSAVQRRAKRAASPEDEATGKGKEKRCRTAADNSHKENRFNCPKCKKIFSSPAILRRHGDCAIQVKDRKRITCTADGCKSRFTRRDALTRHVRRFHCQASGSDPALVSADKPKVPGVPPRPTPSAVSPPLHPANLSADRPSLYCGTLQGVTDLDSAFWPSAIAAEFSNFPPAWPGDYWES